MTKTPRARYTLEFTHEPVRPIGHGQTIAGAARMLQMVDQTLYS